MKLTLLTKTKHDIANELNSYFGNHGSHISESMNAGTYCHYQYLKSIYANSLFFIPVINLDIEEMIICLRNKPGREYQYIFNVYFKKNKVSISHVLCHIINLSLITGIFLIV